MMRYPIGESGQEIVLSENVLDWFRRHAQLKFWQSEAGGQLFARVGETQIAVEVATGPYPEDRRSRHLFIPDAKVAQRDIDRLHKDGLHFVGHWHTHPERRPQPSPTDLESVADNFRRSTHYLNGFILAIVGTNPVPSGLHVSVHDGYFAIQLHSDSPAKIVDAKPIRNIRLI